MYNEYFHQKSQEGEGNGSFPKNDRLLLSFGEQELGLGIDSAKLACSVGSTQGGTELFIMLN